MKMAILHVLDAFILIWLQLGLGLNLYSFSVDCDTYFLDYFVFSES